VFQKNLEMWALISVKPIASDVVYFFAPNWGCFSGQMLKISQIGKRAKKKKEVFLGFLVAKLQNKNLIS
jgi:hypothetical protein